MTEKADSSKQSLTENAAKMETEVIRGEPNFDDDSDLDSSRSTSRTVSG